MHKTKAGDPLNAKERIILWLTIRGFTQKEISAELRMPLRTVAYYSAKLRKKLDIGRGQLPIAGRRYFERSKPSVRH